MRFRRLRGALRTATIAALVGLCFVVFTLLGARLHLNLPASRELIRNQVNQLMATTFEGRLHISRLQHVDLGGIEGVDGYVLPPEARSEDEACLRFWGTSASISLDRLLSSLWSDSGPIDVHLSDVRIRAVHAELRTEANGELGIARAFLPHPQTPKGPAEPSRGVAVRIDRIRIDGSWTHGKVAGSPPLDADLNEVEARFSYVKEALDLELLRGRLTARQLPEALDPEGDVRGRLRLNPRAELDASLDFRGEVMQSPVALSAGYAPSGVRIGLKSERIAPATLARYGVSPPEGTKGSVELAGKGPLSDIQFRGAVSLGKSKLAFTGHASALAPHVVLNGKLSKLDLRSVRKDLPKTSVDGLVDFEFQLKKSLPHLTSRVDLAPTTIEDWKVPGLHAEAHLEGTRAWAFIRAAPGQVTLHADARLDLAQLEHGVAFNASARVPQLGALRRYATLPAVSGDVQANVCGSLYPTQARFEAGGAVRSNRLRAAGFVLTRASVSAKADGSLKLPRFDLTVTAGSLRSHDSMLASLVDFAGLRLTARGTPEHVRVTGDLRARSAGAAPSVQLSAQLAPSRQRISQVRGSLQRGRRRVDLSVARVHYAAPYEVRDLTLTGAGSVRGSLLWGRHVESSARLDRLDLAALSQLLEGVPGLQAPISGIINGKLDVAGSLTSPRGSIDLEIQQARRGSDSFSGEVHLVANEGKLSGRVQVHASRIGSVVLTPRGFEPRGDWTDPGAWLAGSGSVRADFAIDSAGLLVRLGQAERVDLSGLVRGNVEIARAAPAPNSPASQLPTLHAKWSTLGLTLGSGKSQPGKPLLSGVDVRGELRADGASGETTLSLDALQGDRSLAILEASSQLPYARWLGTRVISREELLRQPLSAHLKSSSLPLGELPEVLRVPGIDGELELEANLEGSVSEPDLRIDFRGTGLTIDELSRRRGLSSVGYLEYERGIAKLRFGLSSPSRSLVRAQVRLRLAMSDVLRNDFRAARADAKLVVDDFSLAALPALRARDVRGRARGQLTLQGIGGVEPKARLRLEVPKGRVGQAKFDNVEIRADVTRDEIKASVLMRQPDGFGQVLAAAGLDWEGPIPRLARDHPARVRLLANGWRLTALEPFVRGQIDQLDGRVDANARLDLTPGATKLDGFVRVREGTVQVPALGQQLRNLQARVDLTPSGDVRLVGGSVEGLSGRAYFDAAAKLDGLSLVAANATLRIPDDDALPITYQGIPLGDGSGAIDLKARLTPKENRIDVDVNRFVFQLPRKPHTGVQSLEPDDHIRIGAHARGGFVPVLGAHAEETDTPTGEGAPTLISVDLGDSFEITQGTDLKVKLRGKLLIDSAREHPVVGQIRLDGGRIDISGKLFEIEQGVVTFQADPSNPIVVARAGWDSPAGYKVVAEYTGPLKNGKFRLRAEPALSQNEIVSLILFGTPDGSIGSSQGGAAAGVGAGVATAPLNRAISDVTDLDIATRVDTSDAQSPRPELVVQLTPRISAQVGYNLEEPKPGKAPDRTLFSLEFRIASRWSLATTFGDGGSSLVDLVWRYRY